MTASHHRTLPQPHRDYRFPQHPWYRLQNACARHDQWPLEAQQEVADIGTCPQGRPRVLNPAQIVEIRRRYQAGGITYKELAAEYRVSVWTIGRIIRREGRAGARLLGVMNQEAA